VAFIHPDLSAEYPDMSLSRKAATDLCDSSRQDSLSSNIPNRKRSNISFIVQIIAIFAA